MNFEIKFPESEMTTKMSISLSDDDELGDLLCIAISDNSGNELIYEILPNDLKLAIRKLITR